MGNSIDSVVPNHRAGLGSDANNRPLRLLQRQDLGSITILINKVFSSRNIEVFKKIPILKVILVNKYFQTKKSERF